MLYIRADGNTNIGMGHVMRCLSVAEAAADIDCMHSPVFITADEGCRSMIEDRGFRVIVLDTDYKDMMSELPQLEKLFQREHDILFVDSYQVSIDYYRALRKLVKVACFEDMGDAYPVDLLINYNIYAPNLEQQYKVQTSYNEAMNKYPQRVLLGAKYMPLRKTFQEPSEFQMNDKVTNVTITTGGSDPYFATAAFADALLNDSVIAAQGIHLHLISGPFNQYADALRHRYQSGENRSQNCVSTAVTIHENVKDMRSLFLNSDVVISATGSTIYEVSSLGVPMIVFYFAENQRQGAEALEKLTDIVNAGCFAKEPETVVYSVKETLKRCICDKSYRQLLNRQETGLIDGKGAHRIAEQLMTMF
ncbi:MAG: UDP-2,4-diacetamido-2,4,6-trideoxy-beta-L-altropyranose hydrolase [Lachnospiraceae bacterium]|nr:UDP-2,4-diacetamido-2,4,6-trideoxy-beta-L-altropyranose hydrolase [Lachnospiraceae bacterium]